MFFILKKYQKRFVILVCSCTIFIATAQSDTDYIFDTEISCDQLSESFTSYNQSLNLHSLAIKHAITAIDRELTQIIQNKKTDFSKLQELQTELQDAKQLMDDIQFDLLDTADAISESIQTCIKT